MKPYYQHAGITIYHGDCREVLRDMDHTIWCCVTSPPYWGLRDYGNDRQLGLEKTPVEYLEKMTFVFREIRRVLEPEGTLWLNMGDSYAAHPGQRVQNGYRDDVAGWKQATNEGSCTIGSRDVPGLKAKNLVGMPWRLAFALQDEGWYLRSDIIWSKPNPMPESVSDRPTKSHEYIFLLSKSAKYHYDAEAIKERVTGEAHARGNGVNPKAKAVGQHSRIRQDRDPRHVKYPRNRQNESFSAAVNSLVEWRNKRSVWTVATQPFTDAHFATFPEALITPCILAGCPPNWEVIDPFAGAGTTLLVAKRHNRRAIGIEIEEKYCEIAAKRLSQEVFQFTEGRE